MSEHTHHKHPPLARRGLGVYAPLEFALVGTPCRRIDVVQRGWQSQLADEARVLLVQPSARGSRAIDLHEAGGARLVGNRPAWSPYDERLRGGDYDLALVNGNHFPAARQIAFVDPAKPGTLERRRGELTDVAAVVLEEGEVVPPWLRAHLDETDQEPLICGAGALGSRVLSLVREALRQNRPPLRALLLTGGRSERMGTDKARLEYRAGLTEPARLAGLCSELGLAVYCSVRAAEDDPLLGVPRVVDRFVGLGPLGAIASAFLTHPDGAWLVLACDLPLLDAATLARLVAARDPRRDATAARAADKPWPEPLVAIYEPRAYRRLLDLLSLGYACPRKLLINGDTHELLLDDARPLFNANTPAEREEARAVLAEAGGF